MDVTEKIRKMVGGGNKMGCGPEADKMNIEVYVQRKRTKQGSELERWRDERAQHLC